MEKYLYFRRVADVADDDSVSDDSISIKASNLMQMQPASDTTMYLMFQQGTVSISDGQDGNFANNIWITLTISANSHFTIMKTIAEEIAYGRNPMIVVADDAINDDRSSESSRYLHPCITGMGVISNEASSFS